MAGNLKALSRSGKEEPPPEFWEGIFDSWIKKYGLPDYFTRYVLMMTAALELYRQSYDGKKWLRVKAKIKEAEAKGLMMQEGANTDTLCAHISKFMGYPVRSNTCTVVEFYSYLALMENS